MPAIADLDASRRTHPPRRGGDLGTFVDSHAAIVIFGGSAAATLIRFPLSSIFHGLPLGAKYAFTMRRILRWVFLRPALR